MKDSAKAAALLEAARAELAAKRKIREVRFADTVMGWESEEEAAQAAFPNTVIGWDHPAAAIKNNRNPGPTDAFLAALAAEERAADAAHEQRLKRFVYTFLGAIALLLCGFILAGTVLK